MYSEPKNKIVAECFMRHSLRPRHRVIDTSWNRPFELSVGASSDILFIFLAIS